jgi:uncharacterized protein
MLRRILIAVACYIVLAFIAGIFLAEASLHLRRRPIVNAEAVEVQVWNRYHTRLQNVTIRADDGVLLKGWYIHPSHFNGRAVILLHGITDNRLGVLGYGELFLDHGYAVLLPDARAHGESGGKIATYGFKEAEDTHDWVSWIFLHDPPSCVYGFGESYGAALILQSLAVEDRYCAVAVESPFSTAREMSYERVSGPLHLRPWFGKTIGFPIIEAALWYARVRYGIDLLKPNPLHGITHSRVPVLLIHGEKDHNIRPWHSEVLARAAPKHVELWLVPNAGHTGAWAAAHQQFEQRVLGWFDTHNMQEPVPSMQGAIK